MQRRPAPGARPCTLADARWRGCAGASARTSPPLLPVPGDPVATPASVSAAATDAGEAVLVRTRAGVPRRRCPVVQRFGSALEPGHLVTWELSDVPDWRHAVHAQTGSLQDAERALRHGLLAGDGGASSGWTSRAGAPTQPRRSPPCVSSSLPAWRLPDGPRRAPRARARPAPRGCGRSSTWPRRRRRARSTVAGRPAVDGAARGRPDGPPRDGRGRRRARRDQPGDLGRVSRQPVR